MPGFVDTHVHFPQMRAIGGLGMPLLDWLERCALPEESKLADPDYASERGAASSSTGCSRCGTTTALVFGSHFARRMDVLFAGAERRGLNVTAGLVLSATGSCAPTCCARPPEPGWPTSRTADRALARRGRLRYAVTPRFSLSTTDAMLDVVRGAARHAAGRLWFTSHVNENLAEVADRRRPVPGHRALPRHLPPARPGHRTQRPRAQRARHRPRARPDGRDGRLDGALPDQQLRAGQRPVPAAPHVEHGVGVALGSDVGAGTGLFLLKEGLQAYFMQQLLGPEGLPLTPVHLLYLATQAGARALGLGGPGRRSSAGQGVRRRVAAARIRRPAWASTCGTPPTPATRWPGCSPWPPPPTWPGCGYGESRHSNGDSDATARRRVEWIAPTATASPGRPPTFHERLDGLVRELDSFATRARFARLVAAQYLFQSDVPAIYRDPSLTLVFVDLPVRGRLEHTRLDLHDLAVPVPTARDRSMSPQWTGRPASGGCSSPRDPSSADDARAATFCFADEPV